MQDWVYNLIKKFWRGNFKEFENLVDSCEIYNMGFIEDAFHITFSDDSSNKYVELYLHDFTSNQEDKLAQILKNEDILLEVCRNNVPQDLFECGFNIYPKFKKDFFVYCSCNDDYFFCDEVALAFYFFSNIIKDDPAFIFSFRGFDLKKQNKLTVKSVDDLFSHNFKAEKKTSFSDLIDVNIKLLSDVSEFGVDLTWIYKYLFDLLNDYAFEFKHMLCLGELIELPHFTSSFFNMDEFNSKWGDVSDVSFDINSNYEMSGHGHIVDEYSLFGFLIEFNQFDTTLYSDKIRFLYKLWLLTLNLINNNAIVPQMFSRKNNKYAVRWVPAFFKGNVLKLCRQYYPNCPDDLITYNGKKISKENQVIVAISLIMKGFIKFILKDGASEMLSSLLPASSFSLFLNDDVSAFCNSDDLYQKLLIFELNSLPFYFTFTVDNEVLEFKIIRDGEVKSYDEFTLEEFKYYDVVFEFFKRRGMNKIDSFKLYFMDPNFAIFYKKINPLLDYINFKNQNEIDLIDANIKLILDIDFKNDDFFTLNDLDNFEWKIDIGGEIISVDEFNRLSNQDSSIFVINNKKFRVEPNKLKVFSSDILFLPNNFESYELLQISLLGKFRNLKFELGEKFRNLLGFPNTFKVPDSLNAQLRPYQEIGFSWLIQNIKSGFGSILADDMGLGKTVQVLTCILYLKENNQLKDSKVLIVVPTTLISNWENEIKKFTPTLTYSIYHGLNRQFPQDDVDIVLTSYGIVRSDIREFSDREWFLCVIDEAQNIKNPSTKQTKSVKSLNALHRIALTGTPIENRLLDYWSIFDFTNKGYLSSRKEFKQNYVSSIEKKGDEKILNNLKTITKPFVLRRVKTDPEIISDLPDKNVNDIYCSLTKKQTKLYDNTLTKLLGNLKDSEGINRRGNILKLITALKQICNHPSQYLKTENPKINESGKLELLIDVLENILDMDEKVIIFTQYVEMGKIIEEIILKKFNREVLFLHGSLSRSKRENIIETFQKQATHPILIATLKTGGVGLNLTSASNVIHYDLWWNPAIENQATDRVYRIGQKEDVMVYRFITKGTLEEQIDSMIKDKLELAGMTLDNEETFITEMSDEELKELLSLRLD